MVPLLVLLASTPSAPTAAVDVKVPPGFSIALYADNPLAPDIFTMTIDDAGRVLVAGRGYVRVLVDDDRDGVADRAIDLIDGLKDGPMGLLAEGDSLYVVSEGGLQRYRGYDGHSKLKRPETLLKLKTSGEHDAHLVRRGPDGWLYLLCGNAAGVSKATITGPLSPIKEPVAGALLRISPDGKQVEVVCDGFRNPYAFDFNLDGEPFATDSDNERCVGLPWYESCRFYGLMPGCNYGWRSPQLDRFWRKPPYFLDCVAPVSYLGRGSPTGVACYRHTHFPEKYRGGFFLADWTFGRIDFVSLNEVGSSYTGKPEPFAEAVGTSGFAPTALAVHPKTGELFVSIGGRGTRGGVYRITHNGNPPGEPLPMARRSLDWSAEAAKQWLDDCAWNGHLIAIDPPEKQRQRRQSLELLLRHHTRLSWNETLFETIRPILAFPDFFTRMTAARLVHDLAIPLGNVLEDRRELLVDYTHLADAPGAAVATAIRVLADKWMTTSMKLKALRVIQLAFGDLTATGTAGTVWEGYSLRNRSAPSPALAEAIRASLHTNDADLDREASRTAAALGIDIAEASVLLAHINPSSQVEEDIHYLACLGRVACRWSEMDTRVLVDYLVRLEDKVMRQKAPRDQNWPLRMEEILEALGKVNPELGPQLSTHPEFGRPEHLLLVKPLGIAPTDAARRFLQTAAKTSDYAWTPGLVRLLSSHSLRTTRPLLLQLWERPGLRDAILAVLAGAPEIADAPKYVQGLASFDPRVVQVCAHALASLEVAPNPTEYAAAIKAMRSLAPEDRTTREALTALLRKRSGEAFAPDVKTWTDWAVRKYPDVQKLLAANDGFDPIAWKMREAGIPWAKGDPARGRIVFAKASCAGCHDGGRAMGPSLQGVAKRFSRDDLITAILQPNKDVSPRYRPTRVATTDESVFIGMIVYEASDGLLLQTGPDSVVRVAGDKIAAKRTVDLSMMPAGLLDKLSDQDVADLFAFLQANEGPKSAAAPQSASQFRAGAFAADVTPQKFPVSVNGGMSDRQATSAHDPLHARCLVLDDGKTRVALVVVDSCMIPREIHDAAKELASKKTGIPATDILISATHTHTAPTLGGVFQSDPDPEYIKFLIEKIAAGIETANANLQPAKLARGVGEEPNQVFNRRWRMKEGVVNADPFGGATDKVKMNPGHQNPGLLEPAGPTDPSVTAISIRTLDDRPLSLYANYSLHYVGDLPPLSADYFGVFADVIGQKLKAERGFVGMLSNGTSGDVNNINFREPAPKLKSGERSRLVAEAVADAAIKGLASSDYRRDVGLAVATAQLELPVRKPTPAEVARAEAILGKAKGRELRGLEEIYARETVKLSRYPDTVKLVLQAIRIGDMVVVGIPCEVFTEIGLEIKKASPFPVTCVVSLANGYNGYLPTPAQHALGGYETWRARSSYLGVTSSEEIVGALKKLMQEVK
jgi:putative heme-binding domain-containing protein